MPGHGAYGVKAPVLVWSVDNVTGDEIAPGEVAVNPDELFNHVDGKFRELSTSMVEVVRAMSALEANAKAVMQTQAAQGTSIIELQARLREMELKQLTAQVEVERRREDVTRLIATVEKLEQMKFWLLGASAGVAGGVSTMLQSLGS